MTGWPCKLGSPAIDVGSSEGVLSSVDLKGSQRMLGTTVDIGAYEGPLQVTITGSEGWRMMASPSDNMSYATLLDSLWLQGMSGGDVSHGTPNLYTWDEAAQEFKAVTDATEAPDAGQGFIVYVYDDQDYDGTPDGFPKILPVNQARSGGTITPTLTFNDKATTNDGFNLIGNPYRETIDWDDPDFTKTNLNAPMYIWNAAAGEYQSWNGSAGTLPDEGLIAPWQGFWVQANDASPGLEFTEGVRSTGGTFYKESEKESAVPQITFELMQCNTERCSENSKQETDRQAEISSSAILMFDDQATPGKDRLDAWKLESLSENYLSLYTTDTERHALDINALPTDLESPLELDLDFRGSNPGGKYTLSWNPQDLPDSWAEGSVMLKDLHTDRIINLNKAGQYSFEVSTTQKKTTEQSPRGKGGAGEAGSGVGLKQPTHGPVPTVLKAKAKNPRFILTINPEGTNKQMADIPNQVELDQNYPNPFNPETVIRYGVPEQAQVQINVYDVLGRRVQTLINEQKSPGSYEARFDGSQLASGLYIYRLKIGSEVLTKKMMLIK